ncbi:cytochrome P450 6j1-like [Bacillus rossius redtenbacheri]|uniref:cytochrome P450 6j1-like n=1 Tax=Bacillus rossius redtenbacheri TaxID=93214 RepID=UPI002FDEFD2A
MAMIFSTVLADVTVVVATCLVAAYLYFASAFRYWKRRGVHYVPPTSIFGNMGGVALQREHIGEYLKKVYDSNPDQPVVGLFAFRNPILMVRDLEVVQSIMVKNAHAFLDRPVNISQESNPLVSRSLFALKGKKWRHLRTKLTPTFTSAKMKKMFYLINECGKQLLPCIEMEMEKGKHVMVKDTVARYSTDVISSCAFGVDGNALVDPNSEFRATTRKIFEITKLQNLASTLVTLAPPLIKALKLEITDDNINNYLRKLFWEVVDHRKKNNVSRNDFVDVLMQIKDEGQVRAEEDAHDKEEIKQDSMDIKKLRIETVDSKLEDDDFVAQAFIFIAAGFETSSSVIAFTLYELAINPSIQDKLRRKLMTVLEKHNSEVTYEAIAEMDYLDMVISETLRKYPTVPILARQCLENFRIPGTDITIEKGTSVMIPVLAIHSDPAIYPEPDKFDPERFNYENKNKRSKFAHIPFGEGPRICIGMRFGQMQVKTALVHILTTYQVRPCTETPSPPLRMKPIGVNTPRKEIALAFDRIK